MWQAATAGSMEQSGDRRERGAERRPQGACGWSVGVRPAAWIPMLSDSSCCCIILVEKMSSVNSCTLGGSSLGAAASRAAALAASVVCTGR